MKCSECKTTDLKDFDQSKDGMCRHCSWIKGLLKDLKPKLKAGTPRVVKLTYQEIADLEFMLELRGINVEYLERRKVGI